MRALNVADEFEENKFKIDIDNIKVEKKTGGSLHDTRLVQGHSNRQGDCTCRNAEENSGSQNCFA